MLHSDDPSCLLKRHWPRRRMPNAPGLDHSLSPVGRDTDTDGSGLRSFLERGEALLNSWRRTGPVAVGAPWLKQPPVYPLY